MLEAMHLESKVAVAVDLVEASGCDGNDQSL